MFKIRRFPFDRTGQASSVTADHGSNWPVIYLINGADDIYIGETTSFERRFREHLALPSQKRIQGTAAGGAAPAASPGPAGHTTRRTAFRRTAFPTMRPRSGASLSMSVNSTCREYRRDGS